MVTITKSVLKLFCKSALSPEAGPPTPFFRDWGGVRMDGKPPGELPSPNIFLMPDVSLAPLVFFCGCLVVGWGDEGGLIPFETKKKLLSGLSFMKISKGNIGQNRTTRHCQLVSIYGAFINL